MRQTELLISLSNLENNLNILRNRTQSSIQAVVKANAYGLTYEEVLAVTENYVESYSVITLDEAIQLRKLTNKPVLMLQGVHEENDYKQVQEHRLDFVVHSFWQIENLNKFNFGNSSIWLKINTGMNRLGFDRDDFFRYYDFINTLNSREVVLMSHLAASNDIENPQNNYQIDTFTELTKDKDNRKSLANSGGIFNFQKSHFDVVRPGIAIYGGGGRFLEHGLKPVSKLRSKIISKRRVKKNDPIGYDGLWKADVDTTICYVPIGYADGIPYFTFQKDVQINGKNFKTVGKVNMDLIAINIGDDESIKVGDWVDFWGFDTDIGKLSKEFNTISYQLLTNLSGRVAKNYLE